MDKAKQILEILPKIGVHDDIPEERYHSSQGISKHGLDLINQSPLHYRTHRTEETKALIYGGAFHCLVLEPNLFDEKYVVNRLYKDFRSKKAQNYRDAVNRCGYRMISIDEFDHMNKMRDAIRKHSRASILLDPDSGAAEQSAYWIDNNRDIWASAPRNMFDADFDFQPTGRLCRCRPDFVNYANNIIIDLKTAQCAGLSDFSRAVDRFRYHVQAAYYLDGFRQLDFFMKAFVFVAIEKEPPYGIGIYPLSIPALQTGRELYQRDLMTYHNCMTTNEWPCYPEEMREIDLPRYAKYVDVY